MRTRIFTFHARQQNGRNLVKTYGGVQAATPLQAIAIVESLGLQYVSVRAQPQDVRTMAQFIMPRELTPADGPLD